MKETLQSDGVLEGPSVAQRRSDIQHALFPAGVPRLWCPALTHYDAQGAIDRSRQHAHLRFMSRWVGGLLVPGSVGDGWELTAAETHQVVELALTTAPKLGMRVLVGALDHEPARAAARITDIRARLDESAVTCLCGFAVCPPRGSTVSQDQMEIALADVLALEVPIGLYQLPLVTENEMSPDLVARLALRYPGFVLFKDSSGRDLVAKSGLDLGGVVMLRGADGDHARALKTGGGPYDGLLVGSANSFGAELTAIIEASAAGRHEEAHRLSDRLTSLVGEVVALAAPFTDGNAIADGYRAVDHFYAHGPDALDAPAPRVRAGSTLPRAILVDTRDALERHGLLPRGGYLE